MIRKKFKSTLIVQVLLVNGLINHDRILLFKLDTKF